MTPPRYLRDVIVPALREGAQAAGRPVPRLVAMVPLALGAPDRDPVELLLAGNAGHLKLPHYQDMLRRSGIDVDPNDLAGSAKAVIAGRAFVSGDADEILAVLDEYRAAGVDEIVLNVTGLCRRYGLPTALGELETLLGALARGAAAAESVAPADAGRFATASRGVCCESSDARRRRCPGLRCLPVAAGRDRIGLGLGSAVLGGVAPRLLPPPGDHDGDHPERRTLREPGVVGGTDRW